MKLKKTLLVAIGVIALTLFSNIVFAQDSTRVNPSVVYNDIKHTIGVNAPKIEQAVTSLAKSLKVTADNVWDILVKQQKVWSICILIDCVITIFSWIHFYYRLNIVQKNTDHTCPDSLVVACVITGIIAITGSIVGGIYFQQMLTGFLNPEYGAMQTIAEVATSIK